MPRKTKELARDAYYHVYNRANNRRSIHLAEQTIDFFLQLINEIKVSYKINIYAYCVMKNHYHLFIQTELANLDQAMKFFGERYAVFINQVTNGSGPVFCGRYQAKIIKNDRYLLQVCRYIHLNPVQAGCSSNFLTYKWSSIGCYLTQSFHCVNPKFFYQYFINLDDFINYHEMGNSDELKKFYSRRKLP